jgi:hypothetical protein
MKSAKQNPRLVTGGFFLLSKGKAEAKKSLLDLGFFVHHMFARARVELFNFDLFGRGFLIFGCGVEVPSTCRGL